MGITGWPIAGRVESRVTCSTGYYGSCSRRCTGAETFLDQIGLDDNMLDIVDVLEQPLHSC